jgi:hypothetical protein
MNLATVITSALKVMTFFYYVNVCYICYICYIYYTSFYFISYNPLYDPHFDWGLVKHGFHQIHS